jgi:hypothetical protein
VVRHPPSTSPIRELNAAKNRPRTCENGCPPPPSPHAPNIGFPACPSVHHHQRFAQPPRHPTASRTPKKISYGHKKMGARRPHLLLMPPTLNSPPIRPSITTNALPSLNATQPRAERPKKSATDRRKWVPVAPISFSCPQHRIPLPSVPPSPPTLRLASTSPNRGPNAPKKLATDTRKWVPAASCPKHRIPGPSVPPSPPTPHPPSTSPNREPNAPKKGPRTRENGAHHSYLLLPPSKSRPIHPIQHSIHLPQHLHHPMRTQTCKKKITRARMHARRLSLYPPF